MWNNIWLGKSIFVSAFIIHHLSLRSASQSVGLTHFFAEQNVTHVLFACQGNWNNMTLALLTENKSCSLIIITEPLDGSIWVKLSTRWLMYSLQFTGFLSLIVLAVYAVKCMEHEYQINHLIGYQTWSHGFRFDWNWRLLSIRTLIYIYSHDFWSDLLLSMGKILISHILRIISNIRIFCTYKASKSRAALLQSISQLFSDD